jgi:hypothetical protein
MSSLTVARQRGNFTRFLYVREPNIEKEQNNSPANLLGTAA